MAITDIFGKRPDGIGLPGVEQEAAPINPYANMEELNQPADEGRIGQKEVEEALSILTRYKQAKSNLERRIVEDEEWYKLRHWEVMRKTKKNAGPEPSSGWLFNAILNKHADAMDNIPEPMVLPRERSDDKSAKILSSVLPVVLEYNDFEDTYSEAWWGKLKHGTSAYGVFWNNGKENGMGDVDVREIDLLKLFWEPGIKDIQDSRNLFIVDLVDEDVLESKYPEYKGKLKGNAIDLAEYIYDDYVDNSDKVLLVDWYYKRATPDGRNVLHYAKIAGDKLLYASENDPQYRDSGWYDHGMYPVVLDVLFPETGTPVGFGYVAICKDPQLYIDKLSANILESSLIGTKTRYFASNSTAINRDQMLNVEEPIVDVEGDISDARLQQIKTSPPDGIYFSVLQQKIEEMKDTAANRDVNSGGGSAGVTAASAIAALQEAGNKASRDMIAASYRTYQKIVRQIVELMRQFYDEERTFRIVAPNQPGEYEFVSMSNAGLKDQVIGVDSMGIEMYRRPVFDLKIKAQKKNPFSRMEQNERAKELYASGFFAPENAQAAMGALDMMDFEGIDKVREYVSNGQTLLAICQQLQQQNAQLMQILGMQVQAMQGGTPGGAPGGAPQEEGKTSGVDAKSASSNRATQEIMQARTPMTSYGQRLAERSRPSV